MKNKEENITEQINLTQYKDRLLLNLEIFVLIIIITILLISISIASFENIKEIDRILLIILSVIQFLIGCAICLKIEQIAGYYKCSKCSHKYIPTYNSVLWAMHIGRTRYLKCPKCQKKSWSKKTT